MVRAYLGVARVLAEESGAAESDEQRRAKAATTILVAVSSVEAYLNIFARLWLSEDRGFEHAERITADLRSKKSLTLKLRDWPQLFFRKPLDLGQGAAHAFRRLLDVRNQLMHFSSEDHEFEFENIKIKGLIDTAVYNNLTPQDAVDAIDRAEAFIELLVRMQELSEEQVQNAMHYWTGRQTKHV
jgi:hypothetical protein